jgi:DNA-directed RNA polymerase sigma subunit (sigma70/sigma32)
MRENIEPSKKQIPKRLLEILTEQERQVIEQTFGRADGYPEIWDELARRLKVTSDRITEIEAEAIRKMAKHLVKLPKGEGAAESCPSLDQELPRYGQGFPPRL